MRCTHFFLFFFYHVTALSYDETKKFKEALFKLLDGTNTKIKHVVMSLFVGPIGLLYIVYICQVQYTVNTERRLKTAYW